MKLFRLFLSLPLFAGFALVVPVGCAAKAASSVQEGEAPYDSTVGGGILGAGWGAGTGAIIGNQLSYAGEGTAVGAALGLVAGMAAGYGYDALEQRVRLQEDDLMVVRARNAAVFEQMQQLQDRLDYAPPYLRGPFLTNIYFDPDATSLRSGSLSELEVVADYVRASPFARRLVIRGHSDDIGGPEHAKNVAEARARAVASFLGSKGVALDVIDVQAYGSERPVASNASESGRQLNRRVEVLVASY